uniref:Transcription factor viviparous 1 n=1 Tax=Picea abies TaxID=3329 RepID=Q9FVK1_PICAB|nr:transcription factor viviparous 1 [Picea abies]
MKDANVETEDLNGMIGMKEQSSRKETEMVTESCGDNAAEFLDNSLGKAEDLIPPSSPEWTDYECTETDDLMDAARIFDCVNLPVFEDLQDLGSAAPATSSLGSATTSSSSASVSSPSSSSWVSRNIKLEAEGVERHSSTCAAPGTPSGGDHDVTLCGTDSATSCSYNQSTLVPTLQSHDHNNACNSNAECLYPDPDHSEKIDVLEELQNLDLLDGSDVWDPLFIVPDSSVLEGLQSSLCSGSFEERADDSSSEELPMVFFEWLKSNRDSISPEDLRSIKLKRSTIENAAKHLGGGKKGMLHLLKLILAWVQNHHLQRKRKLYSSHQRALNEAGMCTGTPASYNFSGMDYFNPWNSGGMVQQQDHLQNGLYNDIPPSCTVPVYLNSGDPSMFGAMQALPGSVDAIHAAKYRRIPIDDVAAGSFRDVPNLVNGNAGFTNPNDCQTILQQSAVFDGTPWPAQMAALLHQGSQNQQQAYCNSSLQASQDHKYRFAASQSHLDYTNYRSPIPAASTKEARKNRMARQRRSMSHHHHHQNRQWSSSTAMPPQPADTVNLTLMQYQRQTFMQTDRRQGWKPEKHLKFLLQKVLKQSDVGNLGRIVLPKKEAEIHLPELEARDGISIAMEDIVTSRVWNLRYRFWPNNKSRMYLLENTGDFVRSNGLQEGDFIVIYSDTKTGKYMIRGVKVPRSDTTSASAAATPPTTTKSASGSCLIPDGEDAAAGARVLKIGKSYGVPTSQAVGVTFADSMADASSSSVSDATHSCSEGDPFLRDMINQFSPTKGPENDNVPNLERFPSLDSGDLTIEEILDLVESPDMADPGKSPDNIGESKA